MYDFGKIITMIIKAKQNWKGKRKTKQGKNQDGFGIIKHGYN